MRTTKENNIEKEAVAAGGYAHQREIPVWAKVMQSCRLQMDAWIRETMEREGRIPLIGITDEFTFMMSWIPHYFLTGNETMRAFMFEMRNRWRAWTGNEFYHGFYKGGAEEHHHTENYKRFLARLWYLDPYDSFNTQLIEDFVHHLGNWVDGIPKWYDWSKHRFINRFLGTIWVGEPKDQHNDPGFFRYILLSYLAYLASGKRCYLDLCVDYADQWCRILADVPAKDPLPSIMDADWRCLEPTQNPREYMMGGFTGLMLDLFLLTGKEQYAAAVKRVIEACLRNDPDGSFIDNVFPAHLGSYRMVTGDTSFDETIRRAASDALSCPLPVGVRTKNMAPTMTFEWDYGKKMPPDLKQFGPSFLTLAYQVSGDEDYITRALELAALRLELARSIGNNSRTWGCANGSTNGMVLENMYPCLYAATMGLTGLCQRGVGHHKPLLLWYKQDGSLGLPPDMAVLFKFTDRNERRVRAVNLGNDCLTVRAVAMDGLMLRRKDGLPYTLQGKWPLSSLTTLPQMCSPPWEEVAGYILRLAPGEEREFSIPVPIS